MHYAAWRVGNRLPDIILKPGREKPLLRRHPWIFSGAVDQINGEPKLGETVTIRTAQGEFLASAAYSPKSQILARVWSWDPDQEIGEPFFRSRLRYAIERRSVRLDSRQTNAYRLVHAESDGLPGLILDRYADYLVLQCLASGTEFWRETLVGILTDLTGIKNVYERSDVDVRRLEGLPPRTGVLQGEAPGDLIQIKENGIDFWVDLPGGHKTGFYLDQRENRKKVQILASGKQVLDCFTYTGGFSINALAGGAKHVIAVDSSKGSLRVFQENLTLNEISKERVSLVVDDVFTRLRKFRDHDQKFDLIILDPPKFAPTAKQAHKAARGYKDINLLGFKLLRPGGILVTFSCSGGISPDLFQKIVAGAALDAGVDAQILERLHQGADHPVSLHFPEGAYLKGLVCRIQ
jgi:23S rRNA (cytosine1962-C5)-methyltransferase